MRFNSDYEFSMYVYSRYCRTAHKPTYWVGDPEIFRRDISRLEIFYSPELIEKLWS